MWCALNVVVKLRDLASVASLAKLALVATLGAVLPGVVGLVWVSWEAGRRRREEEAAVARKAGNTGVAEKEAAPPTAVLLPHALFTSSMAFFLFSFQVHEKSILLPLMPLTLLIGGREAGFGRLDWEWAVLLNNVGVFSMWPLLRKNGLGLEYASLTLLWNWAVGYNPFALRNSFVKLLSVVSPSCPALQLLPHKLMVCLFAGLLHRHLGRAPPRARRDPARAPPGHLRRLEPNVRGRRVRAQLPVGEQAERAGGVGGRGDEMRMECRAVIASHTLF